MPLLISFIVPVYNAEMYLSRCLESLLTSSSKNFEVICVNDGSKDRSAEILDKFKCKDSRLKIVHQTNQGVSVARNKALSIAKGSYVVFVDSDDYLPENGVELYLKYAQEGLSPFYMGDFSMDFEKKEQSTLKKWKFQATGICTLDTQTLMSISPSPWAKMFQRDLIEQYGICFPEGVHFAEDYLFIQSFLMHCKVVNFIPESLYVYFIRKGSLSDWTTGEGLYLFFEAQNTMLDDIRTYSSLPFRQAFLSQCLAWTLRLWKKSTSGYGKEIIASAQKIIDSSIWGYEEQKYLTKKNLSVFIALRKRHFPSIIHLGKRFVYRCKKNLDR